MAEIALQVLSEQLFRDRQWNLSEMSGVKIILIFVSLLLFAVHSVKTNKMSNSRVSLKNNRNLNVFIDTYQHLITYII